MNVPYNIADHSIFFFAKGRPWDVPSDAPNFGEIRTQLLSGVHDVEQLTELADVRVSLAKKGLVIEGNEILYNGVALHNVWVDKIFKFQDEGVPFDPIFNALNDLQTNPTPAAIERLPIFVERSQLGFLPDGRIACFKYVGSDYLSVHSGSNGRVNWAPGQKPAMDRSEVDANPNSTCSTGLHVGALDYIKSYGFHGDKRIVLCAVWPHDFVSVPTDYNGGKARVCAAEVLEELDKAFVDEFLAQNQTVVRGYSEVLTPAQAAKVGDWVKLDDDTFDKVAIVDDVDDGMRIGLEGLDYVPDRRIVEIVSEDQVPAWIRATDGDKVRLEAEPVLRDGVYTVSYIDDASQNAPDEQRLAVETKAGDLLVLNSSIVEIIVEQLPKDEDEVSNGNPFDPESPEGRAWEDGDRSSITPNVYQTPAHLRAQLDDSVKVEGSASVPDGTYRVAAIDENFDSCRVKVYAGLSTFHVRNEAIKDVYPRP